MRRRDPVPTTNWSPTPVTTDEWLVRRDTGRAERRLDDAAGQRPKRRLTRATAMWEVPGRQLAGVRVAVLGWDSGGGCARILGKGGNLLRECGGARGFYLHVKHFSWISSVAVSPVYRPAHPRVWPGQTVCWRQPPHISSHHAQQSTSKGHVHTVIAEVLVKSRAPPLPRPRSRSGAQPNGAAASCHPTGPSA